MSFNSAYRIGVDFLQLFTNFTNQNCNKFTLAGFAKLPLNMIDIGASVIRHGNLLNRLLVTDEALVSYYIRYTRPILCFTFV